MRIDLSRLNKLEPKLRLLIFTFSLLTILILQTSNALAIDKTLDVGGGKINITFNPGVGEDGYNLNRQQITAWVERTANAVTKYFDRFPVKILNLSISDGARGRVNGVAYHGLEPLIVISISPSFTEQTLADDWVMAHEMVHLSFPPVGNRHQWLLEGLATYVEPITRVRSDLLTEDDAWKWLIEGTPQGLPEADNKGLDNTSTWGQKYWGGAIFFLLADIRIHQQTKNKFGIENALRAIQENGGSMQLDQNWEVLKALQIGDKATGTSVLVDLYNEMRDKYVMTDLDGIWKDLGVSLQGNKIVYDDTAKSADLRRSIMH